LLSIEPEELPELVGEHVEFSSPSEQQPRLMVHSTTPYASSFETDLTAMVEGRPLLDLTTYVETRGLYLARSGDLVVGRTQPWRLAESALTPTTLAWGCGTESACCIRRSRPR
jgi:hypothetical protein